MGPPYTPAADIFDEALTPDGTPRPEYEAILGALAQVDLAELHGLLVQDVRDQGVVFGVDEHFRLDAVPRVITAADWEVLERGLAQRARALDLFVADAYGDQRIVSAEVLPRRVLDSCDHFEPRLVGLPPQPVRVGVAGLDIVRGRDGSFRVLEDNTRTPSGIAYALAARAALDRHLPGGLAEGRRPIDTAGAMLGETLRAAAPDGAGEPTVVILTDGPENSAFYEHERLAELLGLRLVTLLDLEFRGGRLHARLDDERVPVDVVYRRTDEDRLEDESGNLTPVGAALFDAIAAGTLSCVNAFGTGVADDKLVHAYVEDMIRFYLSEEPLVGSVHTHDLGVPEVCRDALERIDELVLKPRAGYGGVGVVVAPHAESADVRDVAAEVRENPGDFIAQDVVMLSRHPTVIENRLEPRHIDLRPFVLLNPDAVHVVPGGLTRVALDRDALVVNSSQQGGGKDTWVLS